MISLSDLKRLRAAMTQGEWEAVDEFIYDASRAIVEALRSDADATGIVATHNAADVLIECVEALIAERDAVCTCIGRMGTHYAECALTQTSGRLDAALAKITP